MSADPWLPPTPAPPPAQRRRRGLRWWLIAIAAVIVVGAVGAYLVNAVLVVPNADRPATITKLPEANLLLPGSHVFDRSSAKPGYDGASVGTVAGVNASKTQVFDYYTQQLAARGWTRQGSSTAFQNQEYWSKGHYVLGLVFLGDPGDRTYPGESQYTTTYVVDIRYAPS